MKESQVIVFPHIFQNWCLKSNKYKLLIESWHECLALIQASHTLLITQMIQLCSNGLKMGIAIVSQDIVSQVYNIALNYYYRMQ